MQAWYDAQGASASTLAVYVVRGIRKDAPMQGDQRVETVALVEGNQLSCTSTDSPATLGLYTTSTHHMYAVQVQPTYDAPLLAAVNREITHDSALVQRWAGKTKELGVIPNAHTARSGPVPVTARRDPPPAAPSKQEQSTDKHQATSPTERVRKRRKVIKKVKTKNEKGYTITRDVEEYESYSEEEPASASEKKSSPERSDIKPVPTAPAARPPPKPKAKGKPQQPSLTSFFAKRPSS